MHKEFFETFPLYRKLTVPTHDFDDIKVITMPKIQSARLSGTARALDLYCPICRGTKTYQFNTSNPPNNTPSISTMESPRQFAYECQHCSKHHHYFHITFICTKPNEFYVMKIGQYPAWTIDIDKEIEPLLGDHIEAYKHGLVCESQGYGIGAFAYYRRIVEITIDELLDEITTLINPNEIEQYKEALAKTKQTIVASEKISLVKDLLPTILRPNGENPLGLLYGILSEGIHGRSDNDCLADAMDVREILLFLVKTVRQNMRSAQGFTAAMKRQLDKRGRG